MTGAPLVPDSPMVHTGAIWCALDHGGRGPGWECRHDGKRKGTRCHKLAISGTDTCDMHGGKPREQLRAEGEARLTLLRAASELGAVHPAETLLEANRLATVVMRQAAGLVEAGSMSAASLEVLGQWMDRAARIAKATSDADAQDRWVRAQESVATRDWESVRALLAGVLARLGHDWADVDVQGAVRAELEAGEGRG